MRRVLPLRHRKGRGPFSISGEKFMTTDSVKNSITSLVTTGLVSTLSILNMMMGVSLVSVARASDTPVAAQGHEQNQDPYFYLQSMTIEEIPETADSDEVQSLMPSAALSAQASNSPIAGGTIGAVGPVAGALANIGTIVNVGQLAWSIVEANKPASNVSSEVANAIPKNSDWENLVGWSAPQSHQFHVSYKNTLGSTVIDFTYRVIYLYGGNIAGKGHFLNGVSIIPTNLTVSWGYSFAAQAKVSSVINAGTAQNPIAAMQLQMQWTTSTIGKNTVQTQSYYIRGDGQFQALN